MIQKAELSGKQSRTGDPAMHLDARRQRQPTVRPTTGEVVRADTSRSTFR